MSTQCTPIQLEFPRVGRRRVVARFNGGAITSNAGALLLRAVESCTQVCRRAARCFQDHRDGQWVEHTVEELVTQRVVRSGAGLRRRQRPRHAATRRVGGGGGGQGGPDAGVSGAGGRPGGGPGGQEHVEPAGVGGTGRRNGPLQEGEL